MSIRVMSAVWDLDLPAGEKLVLLALADQANDAGVQCWPSVETIMKRCGQGERTVRRALADLEKKGHLTRHHRTGTSTQYHVHPCQSGTPAKSAPLPNQPETPAKLAPKPPVTPKTGKATPSQKGAKAPFIVPDDIPADAWADFEEMRRTIRKPMTPKARAIAVNRLRKLADDGWPPGDVLNHSTLNNYQGLFPPKDDRHGNSTDRRLAGQPAADPLIAALQRAREAEEAERNFGAPDPGAWLALPAGRA